MTFQGGQNGECDGVPWFECEYGVCDPETGRCESHRSDGQCNIFEGFYEMISAQPKEVRDKFRSLVEAAEEEVRREDEDFA